MRRLTAVRSIVTGTIILLLAMAPAASLSVAGKSTLTIDNRVARFQLFYKSATRDRLNDVGAGLSGSKSTTSPRFHPQQTATLRASNSMQPGRNTPFSSRS